MTDGVFTEREWLRNGGGVVRSPAGHWGALCTRPAVKKSIHRNRKLHGGMLAASLMVSALIALCFSAHPRPRVFPLAAIPAAAAGVRIRQVDGLTFDAPTGGSMRSITCTEEELLAGKLLLLDGQRPLPEPAGKAALESIATYGKGMVPVNDLSPVSGRETIRALAKLFVLLRENGAGSFAVWQGTRSPGSGAEEWRRRMQAMVQKTDVDTAIALLAPQCDASSEEWLLPYTVELRMPSPDPELPDPTPLAETEQGRRLLQLAWHCGFVRCGSKEEDTFRFRYVGQAHAIAMTYLDVSLSDYIRILHEKRNITVRTRETTYHIQCIPAPEGYAQFHVPANSEVEVSADNTGWAVAACTISNKP
ncbi:MAG: hypothetical protein IKK08_08070 [Clostridia bacterium]|nr:hypothetical protein [Clostridia bacterium]